MADGGGLENRYGVIPIVGSNPTPSALWCRGTSFTRVLRHRSRFRLWLVVPVGVESQFADELAVAVQDSDAKVIDEDVDVLAGVAAADADVVEPAVVAQREDPGRVDGVVADAEVDVGDGGAGRGGFGSGVVGLLRGSSADGAVRPLGVVVATEGIELPLQLRGARRSGLGS